MSPSFLTVVVPKEGEKNKEKLEIKDYYPIGTYCSVDFDPNTLSLEVNSFRDKKNFV